MIRQGIRKSGCSAHLPSLSLSPNFNPRESHGQIKLQERYSRDMPHALMTSFRLTTEAPYTQTNVFAGVPLVSHAHSLNEAVVFNYHLGCEVVSVALTAPTWDPWVLSDISTPCTLMYIVHSTKNRRFLSLARWRIQDHSWCFPRVLTHCHTRRLGTELHVQWNFAIDLPCRILQARTWVAAESREPLQPLANKDFQNGTSPAKWKWNRQDFIRIIIVSLVSANVLTDSISSPSTKNYRICCWLLEGNWWRMN